MSTGKENKKTNNLLIINGSVLSSETGKIFKSDIVVEDGTISRISENITAGDFNKSIFKIIDADGLTVCPGFFDMHVHLREPGREDEEDMESGINSAIRGGITSLACMPITNPVIDTPFLVKYLKMSSHAHDYNIFPVAAITRNLEGESITEFGLLKEAGAAAFSDDGKAAAPAS